MNNYKANKWPFLLATILPFWIFTNFLPASDSSLKTGDIRIRDPFIYTDLQNKTYYMYAQAANRKGSIFTGVEVYTSKDLINWSQPHPVLKLDKDTGIEAVWAP